MVGGLRIRSFQQRRNRMCLCCQSFLCAAASVCLEALLCLGPCCLVADHLPAVPAKQILMPVESFSFMTSTKCACTQKRTGAAADLCLTADHTDQQ
jgi:hypothetical protein